MWVNAQLHIVAGTSVLSVVLKQTHTHTKHTAVWPVSHTWQRKKKWESPSVPASCLSSLHPPPSAAVHPAPLSACTLPPQQINHSSPGGQALCSSARSRLRGNGALGAPSTWPWFDTAVKGWLFWLWSEPRRSTFHFLHELFSRQWPQRLTRASKQDAGSLCHQLMITALLPEEDMDWAVIRVRRWKGGRKQGF